MVRADYGTTSCTRRWPKRRCAAGIAGTRGGANRSTIQDGFLLLSPEALQRGGFEYDSLALLERRGHQLERLRGDTRTTRFPAWSPEQYPDGYFNPRAGWVESAKVVGRLVVEARSGRRASFSNGRRAIDLLEQDARVVGVQTTDGRELRADSVLVAAGAWTPALLPHLGDVMWATGQPVVHFRVEDPAAWQAPHFPVWAADISRSGWYGFPALDDGTLKIANHGVGRRVHADDPRSVLPAEEVRFRAFVRDHLPALADAPIDRGTPVSVLRHLRRRFLDRPRSRACRLDRGRRGQRTRVQVRTGAGWPDRRRGRGEAECLGAALSLADERARCERGGACHGELTERLVQPPLRHFERGSGLMEALSRWQRARSC